jgi:DNA-binding LytR/AlgR family response regulator
VICRWFVIITKRGNLRRIGGKGLKIHYHQEQALKENRIELFYKEMDPDILAIMKYLESYDAILGKKDGEMKRISIGEIFYIEVIERKCFAYLEKEVYQIDYNLKSFQERFCNNGFVQIGKSMLVNVFKVSHMRTDINMKMQLIMDNGEMLVLNRAFKTKFISYLKKVKEKENENN